MTGTSLRDRLRWLGARGALALGLLLAATSAHAQRAWLDREQIHLGETVTLNIQSDDGGAPDYTALSREFDVSGHSSRTSMEISNGRTRMNRLYAVALRPRRAGEVIVPALKVGNGRTEPLSLMVQADAGAAALTDSNDDVFVRSEADDADPYVQQAVGWVVRLYSAAPNVSGALVQPTPDGASIREIGDDTRYARTINGRTFEVIERRYLLIPERSGEIVVPGARFEGRGPSGWFDELIGGRGAALEAQAPAVRLQVQAAPANAAQPWLPLHDLRIRYAGTPQDLRAGSAAALTVEVVADGAGAGQMPELQLPAIEGAQVFPDPVQADETFRSGRPGVKLTRRFSIVPTRAGTITVPGMVLSWWDVNAGAGRQARLPAMQWTVAPAEETADAAPAAPASGRAARALEALRDTGGNAISGANRVWILATLVFAALWLATLVWGLHRRAAAPAPLVKAQPDGLPSAGAAQLAQALDTGDLGDVAQVLMAMARPPARDIDELRTRLADAAQRDAIDALQRARWGGGDGVDARRQLRAAFARGPRWTPAPERAPTVLPPLYPNA